MHSGFAGIAAYNVQLTFGQHCHGRPILLCHLQSQAERAND